MTSKAYRAAELAALLMSERVAIDRGKIAIVPQNVAADVLSLLRIGADVARWATRSANGEGHSRNDPNPNNPMRPTRVFVWDGDDDAAKDKADARAIAKANAVLARYGASAFVTGDPRGFTFRLKLASGRYNTLGGADCGWGVA